MVKLAGGLLALVWGAYFLRFGGIFAPLRNLLFDVETLEQINQAKATWGQLGDFIGGTLNPFIGALTLLGVLFTLLLQQETMMQMQSESTRSNEALKAQGELSLLAARLHSLATALEVTTEMHRKAETALDTSAIDLLARKEQLAAQIFEINDQLNNQRHVQTQPTGAGEKSVSKAGQGLPKA